MLTVAIMADERRADHVGTIVERLEAQGATPHVEWANGRTPWETAREAWQATEGDHRLILQDDVDFGPSLLERVRDLVLSYPDKVLELFRPDRTPNWLIWTQGIVLPAHVAIDAPTWCDLYDRDYPEWSYHDDLRLSSYCRQCAVGRHRVSPSIVQHLDREMPSLLGHSSDGRSASNYDAS